MELAPSARRTRPGGPARPTAAATAPGHRRPAPPCRPLLRRRRPAAPTAGPASPFARPFPPPPPLPEAPLLFPLPPPPPPPPLLLLLLPPLLAAALHEIGVLGAKASASESSGDGARLMPRTTTSVMVFGFPPLPFESHLPLLASFSCRRGPRASSFRSSYLMLQRCIRESLKRRRRRRRRRKEKKKKRRRREQDIKCARNDHYHLNTHRRS